ncbi:MAG: site-2 protease family protein [bacterium]|nr:site-2 protease family protein [bacterium]
MDSNTLLTLLLVVPPLVIAVVIHEVAHGWVAEKLGDPTARALGRISLNPLVHIDLFMTILLPAMLVISGSPVIFGGAKPVPVDPRYFKNPRQGMLFVAAAGPISNFLILATTIATIRTLSSSALFQQEIPSLPAAIIMGWLYHSVLINTVLAVFNLIPVPPLDGGRIAVGLLPLNLAVKLARLEPYGLLIVFFLLYSGVLNKLLMPAISLLQKLLG